MRHAWGHRLLAFLCLLPIILCAGPWINVMAILTAILVAIFRFVHARQRVVNLL